MASAPAFSTTLELVVDFLSPWWLEVCFMIAFPLGYYFISLNPFGRKVSKHKGKFVDVPRNLAKEEHLHKQLEKDAACGDHSTVLKRWRKVQEKIASSAETLKLVVQALCSVSSSTLVDELCAHLETHRSKMCNSRIALVVLDVVSHNQMPKVLDEVCEMLNKRFDIPMTYQHYEVLLAGHAFADNIDRVNQICCEIRDIGQKLTARAYALMIKGFLCKGNLDAGLEQTKNMRQQGFYVPPFAVQLLFKVAVEANRLGDIFAACVASDISLPHETVTFAMEDCSKRSDVDLAVKIEAAVRAGSGSLPPAAYDPLIKLLVVSGDNRALALWKEMREDSNIKISEGLCVGILARSADSHFLRCAEEVSKYCRERDIMTIAVYSALMKVYAFCGFYNRACDLYSEIRERGLRPDAIMYGCLMRFAVECGRKDLLEEVSSAMPHLDLQNYMSLIKAAGRDKDSKRALALLSQLEESGEKLDLAAYNCVLDALICAGAPGPAGQLASEMRSRFGRLDIVSYNTLLKGMTAAGEIDKANRLLVEMEEDGVTPNDISYNSIINANVTSGRFKEAWQTIEQMERKGIAADHYTVSIMLKALKRRGSGHQVKRVLAMVDKLGSSVCDEEVLLNTLVEVCIHLRESRRLQDLLSLFYRSGKKPSQHLYGALIKAHSQLKQMQQCRENWNEMVLERAMIPNDIVLGCMLDALVCNGEVEEAVALFNEWKGKVGANMVMYSTLIKGFAAVGKADEAMSMWEEIRAAGSSMNAVVYNALIDAQARQGKTDLVAKLFAAMVEDGIEPDAITYSTMVKSHCVKGDMNKALEVLAEMQAAGLVKDCVVFNTILDWCTKNNQTAVADKVLEDFERLKIEPSNFTVGILVKMYGRRRMLDKAFEVARDMPKMWGFSPNPQVFTCLMSACFLNNSVNRALEVFEEVRDKGIDFKSYIVVITGCLRAGKIHEACKLIEDAYGLNGKSRGLPLGQNLSSEAFEMLVTELQKKHLAEKVGVPLLTALRSAGAPINGKLVSSVLSSGAGAGAGASSSTSNSNSNNRPEKFFSGKMRK